jgi:hypothetical protein
MPLSLPSGTDGPFQAEGFDVKAAQPRLALFAHQHVSPDRRNGGQAAQRIGFEVVVDDVAGLYWVRGRYPQSSQTSVRCGRGRAPEGPAEADGRDKPEKGEGEAASEEAFKAALDAISAKHG